MPGSPVTRQRVIDRGTCILGFTGNAMVKSYVFDATTLSADSNGFYTIPPYSLITKSTSDPTKVKVYQALGTNVNAVQTITSSGVPTGGTFTLTFNGQTTGNIAFNASAATILAQLVALGNIGAATNVATGGGALPTAVTVTFQGLLGNQAMPVMTANYSGLTGGTNPAIAVATTTAGQTAEQIIGVFDRRNADLFGNSVGNDEAIAVYDQYTAFDASLITNYMEYGAAAQTALPTCTFQQTPFGTPPGALLN